MESTNSHLYIPFADGSHVVLSAEGKLATWMLSFLSKLLTLECRQGNSAETPFMVITDDESISTEGYHRWQREIIFAGMFYWRTDPFQIVLTLHRDETWKRLGYRIAAARRIFFLAVISRMIMGTSSLMHGTLLQRPSHGDAVLLTGASGMGKSTIGRRFESQGGRCPADDLSVLTFLPDGRLVAQPAPTWSRVHEGHAEVNFKEQIPVISILRLTRGDDDRIVPDTPTNWRLALVSGTAEFLAFPSGWLDMDICRMAVAANGEFIHQCVKSFPPYYVDGALDGHIMEHLERFLTANRFSR